jgi:hypothetical protein
MSAAGQPSSGRFAMLVAVANLVVCGGIGTALLLSTANADTPLSAPSVEPSFSAVDTSTTTTTTAATTSSSTTTTTSESDLAPVSGPGGITTVIPPGWTVAPTSSPGSVQATDPSDSTKFVRYGGSAAPATPILQSHLGAERDFSSQANRPGYARLTLEQTTVRGYDAVDWEFEWDAPEGRRHVHAMYWRADGTEYFVYVSTRLADWPGYASVFSSMLDNARP